jgi:DNA polymerase-3 subunit chi
MSTGADEAPAQRVDFYVSDEASDDAWLKLACRVTERAYREGLAVLIWVDSRDLAALDTRLWTFKEGSFVPHEPVARSDAPCEAPVRLLAAESGGPAPAGSVDIIINLTPEVPPFHGMARRIAEIIDGDEQRRRAGRARFKTYRDLGLTPEYHEIRGGSLD